MRRFSLMIAISLILNVFTPHPVSSAVQKYELLDSSRSKCHTGKTNNSAEWEKCLGGTESPSVNFEILSKQITP